ncbi:DUF805 domain-containing protein [Microvirga flavescens]|uniref:DUF805 domain-containing protein n=1 Tax=Microvirga flavescens TaxID=2249811 RepID=UPI000DD5C1C2|nr:DUF805 domain-containing protein [Microvirga flavescens]
MEGLLKLLRWFDPRGRMSRNAYLRLVLRLVVLSAATMVAGIWLATMGIRFAGYIAVLAIALVWLSSLAQFVRRLHDRNLSGWWLVPSGLFTIFSYAAEALLRHYPITTACVMLIGLVFQLWLMIETLFRRGTTGPNRYGPDPRDPVGITDEGQGELASPEAA